MKIKIKDIVVPESRWKRDVSNTDGLRESIEKYGVLVPLIVSDEMELIAGGRRLTFALELGLEEVDIRLIKDLSFYEKKCIELEENIRRKQLSWSEKDIQLSELHELEQKEHGKAKRGKGGGQGWTTEDTANKLKIDRSGVSKALTIARALKIDPSLANESTRAAALAKYKRRMMFRVRELLAEYCSEDTKKMFHCGDSRELIKGIGSESVGLLLTDIPYDIEVEKTYNHSGRMKDEQTSFKDGDGFVVLKEMKKEIYRIMMPGSHLYFFCSIDQVGGIREEFEDMFRVRHMPIIWDKVYRGYTPTPDYMIPRNYEVCIFMTKGTRGFNLDSPLAKDWSDVWHYPKVASGKKMGINEKPLELLRDIVKLSSDENEVVLDLFCGTGPTVEAAFLENRIGIGFDNNEEVLVVAKVRVEDAINNVYKKEKGNGEN